MSGQLAALALAVQLPAFPGTVLGDDVLALLEEGLGGVCLFGSNTSDGPDALANLTASVRRIAPEAVVAVDEEGGDVTRLNAANGSPVLGALALGTADDLELTRQTGRRVGDELASYGVTLDLAPVADVNSQPDNPVIGTRSFGADGDLVAAHVTAWLGGLQSAGVAACVKHFPGHGDTATDSHLGLPVLDVHPEVMARRELVPFTAAVDAGVAAVMTSHILVPSLDPARPATLSADVLRVLRDRHGFGGVVVSDALDMAGASAGRGVPEAAVQALAAGVDLLCLGADKDVALVRAVQTAVVGAVRSGRLDEERLASAAKRVGGLRLTAAPTAAPYDASREVAGAARSLSVEGDLPDLTGASVVRIESPATIAVGEMPWGLPCDVVLAPGRPMLLPSGPLVVQVRDAHRQPQVLHVLGEVRATGQAVVEVEWGWPGPPSGLPRICARGWSRPGADAVVDTLRRAGWDR